MRPGRMRYHHLGLPAADPRPGEEHLTAYKVFVSGSGTNPYGIEWLRYEADCPLPELVRTVAHVAFEVEDLEAALAGHKVIIAPNSPSPGVRVAFIEACGAPVEFLQFDPGDPRSVTADGSADHPE